MKKLVKIICVFILTLTMCACTQKKNNDLSSKITKNEDGVTYEDDEKSIDRWQENVTDGYHYNLTLMTNYIKKKYDMRFQDKEIYHVVLKKGDTTIFDEKRECAIYNKETCSFHNLFVKKEIEDNIEDNNYCLIISKNQTSIKLNFKIS